MKQFEKCFSDKNLFFIQTMDKKQVFCLAGYTARRQLASGLQSGPIMEAAISICRAVIIVMDIIITVSHQLCHIALLCSISQQIMPLI